MDVGSQVLQPKLNITTPAFSRIRDTRAVNHCTMYMYDCVQWNHSTGDTTGPYTEKCISVLTSGADKYRSFEKTKGKRVLFIEVSGPH